MGTGNPGTRHLAEFNRAHAAVREQFWDRLRRDTDAEHQVCQRVEALYGVVPKPRIPRTQWSERWRRRAEAYRIRDERGWRDNGFEAERERLKLVPTEEYVERIAGTQLVRGKALCPLPGHDERTPSFAVQRDNRWRCYGCQRAGDIYEFGAILWDLSQIGSPFLELHKRLSELWP